MLLALLSLVVAGTSLAYDLKDYKIYPLDREQRQLLERRGNGIVGPKQILLLLESRFALVDGDFKELGAFEWGKALPKELFGAQPFVAANCRKIRKVFLDPGHGGGDLGATLAGVLEKDVALEFAKLVEAQLKSLGFLTSFSRTRDVFLPLDIRPQIAKEWGADIFVSIHMNSSPSPQANGTETYILSADATDDDARKLALKENSIMNKVTGSDPVKDILWDMEQTLYLQESAYLAADIQQSIVSSAQRSGKAWKNRGVRQAPFFVLSRASMPAVLLELGYLSNERDRSSLRNKKFLETLAKALAEGVKKYSEVCKK